MTSRSDKRTAAQNRALWAALSDLSKQVEWIVDGEKTKITVDDWKDVLSAALFKQHRMALGIEGGLVVLGLSTSAMTKAQMSDLIDLTHAFGNERGVHWSNPLIPPVEAYSTDQRWRDSRAREGSHQPSPRQADPAATT